ncbi:MAG: terpene cyclase/mutase family protein [Verrucomicrobia bacterium]|nr:terpene cyclase/mutase family protein [Verrucomicrobiota bacterium]
MMKSSLSPFQILLCLPLALLPLTVSAQMRIQSAALDEEHLERLGEKDDVDRAVDAGLQYLLTRQNPTHGYFEGQLPNTYTALSCMAIMAVGHMPDRSEYGEALRRGILFLVDAAEKNDGYFGAEGQARMYGHAIATLALLEAYGMMPTEAENRRVRDAIQKAIQVILDAQVLDQRQRNHYGGWRYQPRPNDADLSVTVWQVLALRAADNCGLEVPQERIDLAMDYVRRTFRDDRGGFAYMTGHNNTGLAMRASGIVCILAMGEDPEAEDRERILRAADFTRDFDPGSISRHFFYTAYYAATSANMIDDEHRDRVLPAMEAFLIGKQNEDGSFPNHRGHDGGVYATAFSVITLAVRYQYLPIYQE